MARKRKYTKQDAIQHASYVAAGYTLFGKLPSKKVMGIRAFFEGLKYLDDE